MEPITIIIIAVAAVLCVGAFFAGVLYRKKIAEAEIGGAEEKAKAIIAEAEKTAETKKKEFLIEAKEEIHKNKAEFEKESKETEDPKWIFSNKTVNLL